MHPTDNILLLSDVHLSLEAPDITRRFLDFLHNKTQHAKTLYILGDLFELWIGDDAPGKLGLEIAAAFQQLTKQGKTLYFMHGNRDFLLAENYAEQAGIQLLEDPSIVRFNNQTVLLSHGDAWCTDDIEYQAFRNHRLKPETRKAFLTQPVSQRMAFARNARDASQAHTQNSATAIMDVNRDAILDAFNKYAVETIIHGHTHRPADHHYDNDKRRLVLGDWYSQASWLEVSNASIQRHGSVI